MKSILMIPFLLVFVPAVAMADVPTEAQLEEEVRQMAIPRVEARLKARAAAYRMYQETARSFGMDQRTASVGPIDSHQLALLRR